MARYFIATQYIGTAYSGFQSQPNHNTIQDKINKALSLLLKEKIETTTSSRTDTGVHAQENYLHFDTTQTVTDSCIYNLNCILPLDIVIQQIIRVKDTAHCRFDAISRSYNYCIHQTKQPFSHNRSYFFPFALDIDLLQQATAILLRHQNFTSFSKRNTQVNNFICQLSKAEWKVISPHNLEFNVESNRFLRGMVRALVSTMLLVGRKKITPQQFEEIIQLRDCTKADFSAPGEGLYLQKVKYDWESIC